MLRLKFIWFFPFSYFFAYLCLYGRSNISTSLQELSFKWTYVRCIGREKQGIFLWCALETNRRQLSIAHYLAFLSLYLYSISVFLSLFLYHYLFLSLLSPLSLALSLFVPVYQPFLLFLILRCRLVWIWARKKWPHSVQVREGDQICENK